MCAPPSSHKGPTQLHILWRWGWVYLASCLHRIASTLAREPARNARKHCAFLVEVTHRRPQHATCVQVFWPQFLTAHHTRSPRSLNRYRTWLLPSFRNSSHSDVYIFRYPRTYGREVVLMRGVFTQTSNPASHLPILVECSAPTPPIDVADSRTPTGQTYATDVSCISHGSTCDDVISRSRAALHLLKKGVCEFGVGGHRPPLGFEKGKAPTQVEEIRLFILSFHCRFCVINSGCPHLSP